MTDQFNINKVCYSIFWKILTYPIYLKNSIEFVFLPHGCPERHSIPMRFWKSNLGLIMLTTWKSIKSYEGIRRKNRPFQAKTSYGGSKVGFGTFFEPKNEKNACKTLYKLARIFILGSYDSLKTNSSDDTSKPHKT